jgi:hypothetical protein
MKRKKSYEKEKDGLRDFWKAFFVRKMGLLCHEPKF